MNKSRIVNQSEIKNILVEGMKCLRDLCESYDLNYFLAFGTLLGAVRHEGFIPWDDDVDIWMPRSDYNRLINSYDLLRDKDWELLSYNNNEGYFFPWAKLCNKKTMITPSRFNSGLIYGVSIDIFPLDILYGDSYEEVKIIRNELGVLFEKKQRLVRPFSQQGFDRKSKVKGFIKRIYYKNIGRKLIDLRQTYDDIENAIPCEERAEKYLTQIYATYDAIWRYEDFFNFSNDKNSLSFEGNEFRVPSNYDNILTKIYGDYLTPPPENKRISHHKYIALYKSDLY